MPGIIPASKSPSKNRTAETDALSLQNAVQTEQIPKPSDVAGRNHPGPIYLQAKLAGISKMMYEM